MVWRVLCLGVGVLSEGVLGGHFVDWGVGALWVLVSCWGFTVGAIVGGWGLGGLGFAGVIIP